MKHGLSGIAKSNGYKTVKTFMTEYWEAKAEYEAYQKEVRAYNQKPQQKVMPEKKSVHDRLERSK